MTGDYLTAVFREDIVEQARRLSVEPRQNETPGGWQDRVRMAAIRAQPGIATPTPPIEGRDADVERVKLAKSLYWADVKLGENADRIRDEWLESWWTECSTMPLSGPGFLRKWFALADAALQALGERG